MVCSLRGPAAAGLLWLLVPLVQAQGAAPAARHDPLNPRAEVPAAVHRSALQGYKPAGDVKVGSWKEANEVVNRIGGWRAYAREAQAPAAAPAAAASAPSAAPAAAASAPAAAPAAAASAPASGAHHGTR